VISPSRCEVVQLSFALLSKEGRAVSPGRIRKPSPLGYGVLRRWRTATGTEQNGVFKTHVNDKVLTAQATLPEQRSATAFDSKDSWGSQRVARNRGGW
jgi:hypothetical protein